VYYWENDLGVRYEFDTTYPSDVYKGKSDQLNIIVQVNGTCGAHPEPDTLFLRISIEGDKSTQLVWNNFGMVIRVTKRGVTAFKIMPSSYYQCDTAASIRGQIQVIESSTAAAQAEKSGGIE
jgi:hypothetical protein